MRARGLRRNLNDDPDGVLGLLADHPPVEHGSPRRDSRGVQSSRTLELLLSEMAEEMRSDADDARFQALKIALENH
jgi:hypothetical protein